jgi:CelD/BcsL family acetyltransferase involved in cellulose biosynthesis
MTSAAPSAIDRIESLDRFRAIADDWAGLAATARTPLLDHDWCLSCAETLHDERMLRIVTVRHAGALAAAAPMAVDATPSGQRLTLLGASRLHEPGGWLFSSTQALTELVDASLRPARPMHLQRIPGASPLIELLPEMTRRRAVTLVRQTAPSLGVPIRGSWDDYYGSLTSQIRANLPRLRRKAERDIGRMEVSRVCPAESQVDGLLEQLMAVEGSGWKGRMGSSLERRADLRGFFRAYCRRAARRGTLRVTLLSLGGTVGAMELATQAYGRLWQLKIGYHERLAAYYPGLHLVQASIRAAFEDGLESYEFLGSAESWEERWRPEPRTYQLIAVYPFSVSGMIGAGRDLAGVVWRRAQASAKRSTEVARA